MQAVIVRMLRFRHGSATLVGSIEAFRNQFHLGCVRRVVTAGFFWFRCVVWQRIGVESTAAGRTIANAMGLESTGSLRSRCLLRRMIQLAYGVQSGFQFRRYRGDCDQICSFEQFGHCVVATTIAAYSSLIFCSLITLPKSRSRI